MMKYFLSLTMFLFSAFYTAPGSDCKTCSQQEGQYNCAANTLSMNFRLCMDISEVSGLMYKTYLEELKVTQGTNAEAYTSQLPDFDKWQELFPSINAAELANIFFNTDELALTPITAISYEQAIRFCSWRTEQFKKELSNMSADERAQFPKEFKFRLPSAKEWGRIRFMTQKKDLVKTVQKITDGTTKAYKIKKNKLINENPKIDHIYGQMDEKLAMYNLFNNVAEMTSEEGVAMGGSWHATNEASKFDKEFGYQQPEAWLGFRCVFEILK